MVISKDEKVDAIIEKYPSLIKVFIQFGLPCLNCGEPYWGTIEELAKSHNINIEELLIKLNEFIKEM